MKTTNRIDFNITSLFRRAIFFLLVPGLVFTYLFLSFKGLDSPKAMEQAQIAREIARGEGFATKMIRPIAVGEIMKKRTETDPVIESASRDTYYAPFYPLVLSAVLKAFKGDDFDAWKMEENQHVYGLDRVVAGTAVCFFLLSIAVSYFFIGRIFDYKIASVVALLMLLCDLMWNFSLTGLPQMLMLFLFSCASFFAYLACDATKEKRATILPAIGAAIFFALLAFTHWLAIWIVFGYTIYAALNIKPRGVVALISIVALLPFLGFSAVQNLEHSDSITGTGFFSIYNGLEGTEDTVMRSIELGDNRLDTRGLVLKVLRGTLLQTTRLFENLGGMLTAPIFFLALLHPFKNASIASFRWCILSTWLAACFGMAIFGISDDNSIHSNQLHILFAPIMAGYGLAYLSILYGKIDTKELPFAGVFHFVIVIAISAGSLIIDVPKKIYNGIYDKEKQTQTHFPPYLPNVINKDVSRLTRENEIVVTDQPWAVSWYADRKALWLPNTIGDFLTLEKKADFQETPFSGVLITPYSTNRLPFETLFYRGEYHEFASLLLDSWVSIALKNGKPRLVSARDKTLDPILDKYSKSVPIASTFIIYHTLDRDTSDADDK